MRLVWLLTYEEESFYITIFCQFTFSSVGETLILKKSVKTGLLLFALTYYVLQAWVVACYLATQRKQYFFVCFVNSLKVILFVNCSNYALGWTTNRVFEMRFENIASENSLSDWSFSHSFEIWECWVKHTTSKESS